MSLTDSSFAGNEVEEATANFAFDDDEDKPLSASVKSGEAPAKTRKPARRRPSRQAKKEEPTQTDECGACGADVPVGATECGVCGAKFG